MTLPLSPKGHRYYHRITFPLPARSQVLLPTDHNPTKEMFDEFLVSKETVVLRRWERSKQKFGFIKRVDKG